MFCASQSDDDVDVKQIVALVVLLGIEERCADRQALIAELADAEACAAAEREEADAVHQEELARISCNLDGERARIADAQKLLAALSG